ncbi:MAG: T9SS type A sorting domain-containing protein, partial [Ignavibacteriales bacterium]|nr:T9SS type A sorting domain-containing protein [Ignavibacteriales bacterium]
VSIVIYDILGRQVAGLVNDVQEAGVHTYPLSASKFALSSGVYFYTMKAGSFSQTKKLVLMK